MSKHSLWQGSSLYLHADFLCTTLPGLSRIIILIPLQFLHNLGFMKEDLCDRKSGNESRQQKSKEWKADKLTIISTFKHSLSSVAL